MSSPLLGGSQIKPGTHLGGYVVLELLGQGGAGRVYGGPATLMVCNVGGTNCRQQSVTLAN